MVLKLLLFTFFGIQICASKPPDIVESSNTTEDKNSGTYLYGYSIPGKDNALHERIEFRHGEQTQGNIVVQLPQGESISNVQYTADNLGFHPVVRISTKNNHSEVTSHFALGDTAVNKLNSEKNTNFEEFHKNTNETTTKEKREETGEGGGGIGRGIMDTISKVLSTLFPNGVEHFRKQQEEYFEPNLNNKTENILTNDDIYVTTTTESAENIFPVDSQEEIQETSQSDGTLHPQSISTLIESTRDLVRNEDVLDINSAMEPFTEDYQNLQSNYNYYQVFNTTPPPIANFLQYDDLSGFNSPIIVEDNMLSQSQDIDRMYVLPPARPSTTVEIVPSKDNFNYQIQPENQGQINVQILKDEPGKTQYQTSQRQSKSSLINDFHGYQVKEKIMNDLSPTTVSTLPKSTAPLKSTTSLYSQNSLFITPHSPSSISNNILAPIQAGLRLSHDNNLSTTVSTTTPIPQKSGEKTIVEVQKAINVHNMMIKQDGNYFEQHEEYLRPYGLGSTLTHQIDTRYLQDSTTGPSSTVQYTKAPTFSTPKFQSSGKSTVLLQQSTPQQSIPQQSTPQQIAPQPSTLKTNVVNLQNIPTVQKFPYLKISPYQNPYKSYIPAETMLTPVASSYQIISKDIPKVQQLPSKVTVKETHENKNYKLNNNNNNHQAVYIIQHYQQPQKSIETRPLTSMYSASYENMYLNRPNLGYNNNNNNIKNNNNKPVTTTTNLNHIRNLYSHTPYNQHHSHHPHHHQHRHIANTEFVVQPSKIIVQNQIPIHQTEIKKQVVSEKVIDRPYKIEVPKYISQLPASQQQQQQHHYYPLKEKHIEKFTEKQIPTNAIRIPALQVPLQIPIQVPIHIPIPIHMPVAIATSAAAHSPPIFVRAPSFETSNKHHFHHHYPLIQQNQLPMSPLLSNHDLQQFNLQSETIENSLPLNYQVTLLEQETFPNILNTNFIQQQQQQQQQPIKASSSFPEMNVYPLEYANSFNYKTNTNIQHNYSGNTNINNNNNNIDGNTNNKNHHQLTKKPISISSAPSATQTTEPSSSQSQTPPTPQPPSQSSLVISQKDQEYIGPVPPKNEQSQWNSNNNNRQRATQYKRSYDFEKNLRMEYGFKPPMVPSIEIDEKGMPINRKDDDENH